ncbi:sulfite exporter TauE/SafE family protein [Pontibacter saemangeumensis]|uniref:Probable membrane transporter protein n=1 Tax=Pontibacter saemangeumensis TaxID=1084525 RepID=A0ABP8M341_9BACT
MQEIVLFIVGVAVSAFGVTVGFGGGVFLVPILILFFGYNIEVAIGSSMAAMVPAALIASFFNSRNHSIDYLVGALLQLPAMAGTVLGAYLVASLPVQELQMVFALFVLVVGITLLLPHTQQPPRHTGLMYLVRYVPTTFIRKNKASHLAYRLNGGLVSVFGFVSGTVAGLFGIGGGFLQIPIMTRLFRIPAKVATSTSLFILVVTSFTGFISHFLIGNVLWSRSLPVVLSFTVGSLLASLFKKENQPGYNLEKLIAIGLLLAGIGVLLNLMLKSHTGFSF